MNNNTTSSNNFALVAVCLSALMLGLEITSIPSILPTLEGILSADFQQLQWIMNAYTIAMCSVLMTMGTLGDRFGRKRIFIIGIVGFAIASLVCGLATSAPVLIAARAIQGISAAAMLACQVAVLSQQFRDGAERGKAFGWWGITFGMGLGFGPIVGGAIVTLASWEWVFLIHVLIAVITFIFAAKGVEESLDPSSSSIDFGGMITLSAAVFGFVYLITQGQEMGITSGSALVIAGVSVASLILFVIIENRVARPMFDFSVFGVRKLSGALLGSAGMNFSFWPFVVYLPIYLQAALGYDAIMSGLTVLAYTVPTIVVPPLAEKLLLRRGPGFVIPLGLFTIGAGFMILQFVTVSDNVSWMTLLPGCVLAGVGLGLTNTPVTNTATAALPPEQAGMASGMDMSARMISLAVNIALMGVVLVAGVSAYLYQALPVGHAAEALSGFAEAIAAGNFDIAASAGFDRSIVRDALASGIGWVTLYGAVCAWILALFSALMFGRKRAVLSETQPS